MSDTDSDDETEGVIDLSLPKPRIPTLKPYSLELLGSPKNTRVAKTVPVLRTSQDPDEQQQEKVVSSHSKTKFILVPKKRRYEAPPETQAEQQVTRVIRYIPTQSKVDEVIPAALTDPSPDNSGVIGNKLPQQLVNPDKPSVKSVSRAVKKQHQGASTSKFPSSKASTSVVAATKLPTSLASTSRASTSRASTSNASTSKVLTSEASTLKAVASKASTSKLPSSKASTPEVPESKLPTPLASTSKALTSSASTSRTSTSKASTSKASTSKVSTSEASTSKAVASKASFSKLPSSKASTPEVPESKLPTPLASTSKTLTSSASTSRASTSEASTSKAVASKASTSKLPSSKASTPEVPELKLPTPLASTLRASISRTSTSKASTSKTSTSKASPSKPSASKSSISRELRGLHYNTLGFKGRKSIKKASTSKVYASTSRNSSSDDESSFWLRTAKTKFSSNEFREYLREANFSERQAEGLQNLLRQVTQKMTNALNNSDRLVKTHKCSNCEFTICHQCVCLFFLQVPVPISNPPEVIQAQETVICICNFAFFHVHDVNSSRAEGVNIASVEQEQQPSTRKSNIATIRCSACDMIVAIQHPPERKVENTLIQWSAVESDNEQEFHASITAHLRRLQRLSVPPLTLGEMFMCTNKCCLLFHRCDA